MDGIVEFPLTNPDEIAAEAWAAMGRQDTEEALRLWAQLRREFPDRADAHIWPIQVLWQAGRLDEADKAAVAAFARFPKDANLLVQRGWVAMGQERWSEALKWWAEVRAKAPELPDGYIWAARALWLSGDLTKAKAMAAKAAKTFPDNTQALVECAWIAAARQDWDEALGVWVRLRKTDPERVDWTTGTIQALRMVGKLDEAEALAAQVLARAPDSAELLVEHVWTAIGRRDWAAAKSRLATARAKASAGSGANSNFAWIESQIRDGEAAADAGMPLNELVLAFESLGDRCDFGAVQRRYGVEPLGLLRFAYSPYEGLLAALKDRFQPVGTVEDTSFEMYKDEHILRMKKYGLIFHTFVYERDLDTPQKRDAFRQQQRRRLAFLKGKLLDDLDDPQKIFVYACNSHVEDAHADALFAALRTYGPASLLYVRPERRGHPAGTVEVRKPGLYLGYFSGLADFVDGGQPPFEEWRKMCIETHRLAQS